MDKNFLQDVVPPAQKKSIRNIPIPNNKRTVKEQGTDAIKKPASSAVKINKVGPKIRPSRRIPTTPPKTVSRNTPPPIKRDSFAIADFEKRENKSFKKVSIIGGVALALILALVFLFGFSGAEIRLSPKQAKANIDTDIEVLHTDLAINGEFSYNPISLDLEKTETIKAEGEEEVELKASGTITIYNEYSTNAYSLIKNTRFQTEEGLVYRIDESIEVPGYKEVDGQMVPGELDVKVFADSTGEEYNIGSTEFTIPGFQGLEQFDKFSAKSKTNMTGGFVGKKRVVNESDKEEVVKKLEAQLQTDLVNELNKNEEDNLISYFNSENAFKFEVTESEKGDSSVEIRVKGTVNAIVFDVNKLGGVLASKTLSNVSLGENISIQDPKALELNMSETEEEGIMNLSIKGPAHFVWNTDSDKLRESLAGSNRKDMKEILKEFPSIERAEAAIKPFWKNKFPKEPRKIDIIIVLEE